MDQYTETTYKGWGTRITESIKGVAFGVVLFLGSFVLLFWNEGRAVRTAKSLAEGAAAVVDVAADKVDSANDKKLVHLTAQATTEETLTDDAFGVAAANAIKLLRKVEMYQWEEKKKTERRKKLGGGEETVTTYTYDKAWSDDLVDSSRFAKQAGHENPPAMEFPSKQYVAQKVAVGAFALPETLVGKIGKSEPAKVDPAKLPEAVKAKVKPSGAGYYLGDPANTKTGDLRISFSVVPSQTVSIVSRQVGGTFEPYPTKAGDPIHMLSEGTVSADSMFKQLEAANIMTTWILRLVGFIVMAVGLSMVFKPLVTLADVLPFLGDLLQLGIGLFCGLVALVLSLITIAIAWLFYRPVIGIVLLVVAAGLIYFMRQRAKARRAAAPTPDAGPPQAGS